MLTGIVFIQDLKTYFIIFDDSKKGIYHQSRIIAMSLL